MVGPVDSSLLYVELFKLLPCLSLLLEGGDGEDDDDHEDGDKEESEGDDDDHDEEREGDDDDHDEGREGGEG